METEQYIFRNEYIELAELYDVFMKDVDYDEWVNIILTLTGKLPIGAKVIELACGTGNITLRLAKKGLNITALDVSEEMLTEAEKKLSKKDNVNLRKNIRFVNQDMRYFDLGNGYEAIFCICDGFNYILTEKELVMVFKKCFDALKAGASLVFDISSIWKLENILGNNSFKENREEYEIYWFNSYDEESRVVELDLTFLMPEKNNDVILYRKFQEHHIQRGYTSNEIKEMLEYAGFQDINVFGTDGISEEREKDERVFFSAKK